MDVGENAALLNDYCVALFMEVLCSQLFLKYFNLGHNMCLKGYNSHHCSLPLPIHPFCSLMTVHGLSSDTERSYSRRKNWYPDSFDEQFSRKWCKLWADKFPKRWENHPKHLVAPGRGDVMFCRVPSVAQAGGCGFFSYPVHRRFPAVTDFSRRNRMQIQHLYLCWHRSA